MTRSADPAPPLQPRREYAHMCRDEHVQIGHNDSSSERCPVCRERDRADAAEADLIELRARLTLADDEARSVEGLIADLVDCADERDGGKLDARQCAERLVALVRSESAAELTQTAQARDLAIQQRDKWLAAFNGSEQFQNGPTKRAEAAEAIVQAQARQLEDVRAQLNLFVTEWNHARDGGTAQSRELHAQQAFEAAQYEQGKAAGRGFCADALSGWLARSPAPTPAKAER